MTSPSKTMDQCSASDCAAPVAPGLLFCRERWPLIPMEHKLAMVEAYRPLTERHLPLQRAVLVAKHRDAVLAAAHAIVRPVTAPEPEIHLCAGPTVPADLSSHLARRVGNTRLPDWATPPYPVRLSPSRTYHALELLNWLTPCWAMGVAPTRDAVLSLLVRMDLSIDAALSPLGPFAHKDALEKWRVSLDDLIRAGAVAERSYGRIGAASA